MVCLLVVYFSFGQKYVNFLSKLVVWWSYNLHYYVVNWVKSLVTAKKPDLRLKDSYFGNLKFFEFFFSDFFFERSLFYSIFHVRFRSGRSWPLNLIWFMGLSCFELGFCWFFRILRIQFVHSVLDSILGQPVFYCISSKLEFGSQNYAQ